MRGLAAARPAGRGDAMRFVGKSLLCILPLLVLLAACNGERVMEETGAYARIEDVPEAAWKELGEKKIYFGHQSVGFNILEGVRDLMKEHPQIKLNIVETSDEADFNVGIFAHSRVGRNLDAGSKAEAFARLMDGKLGDRVDTAFFKLCYLDVDAKTDVDQVFAAYKAAMAELEEKYPETNFLHVTMPLTTSKTTWKTWIKKLTGKKDFWEYDDNVKRNEFNERLSREYGGNGLLFDLAKAEASFPDGKVSSFTKGGKRYYSLVPDYTYDGGHLNETGRKKVAEQLRLYLVNPS